MTAFAGYFGFIAFAVNSRLALHDGGNRFKCYSEFNRHTIADTALYTAREIGAGFDIA